MPVKPACTLEMLPINAVQLPLIISSTPALLWEHRVLWDAESYSWVLSLNYSTILLYTFKENLGKLGPKTIPKLKMIIYDDKIQTLKTACFHLIQRPKSHKNEREGSQPLIQVQDLWISYSWTATQMSLVNCSPHSLIFPSWSPCPWKTLPDQACFGLFSRWQEIITPIVNPSTNLLPWVPSLLQLDSVLLNCIVFSFTFFSFCLT